MVRSGAVSPLAVITFFILVKGAKGATFMTPESIDWIKASYLDHPDSHICRISAVILQILISFFQINILKIIVLVGTFALAMAFAANDLVNFIGVPLAGLSAYTTAMASSDPLNVTHGGAQQKCTIPDFHIVNCRCDYGPYAVDIQKSTNRQRNGNRSCPAG